MTARQSHWRIMFCWQNLTLWYMMFAAERYALTNTLTAPKPLCCMLLSTNLQVIWQVAPPCQQSSISFWCVLACQSSRCLIVRHKTAVETVGIWGLFWCTKNLEWQGIQGGCKPLGTVLNLCTKRLDWTKKIIPFFVVGEVLGGEARC